MDVFFAQAIFMHKSHYQLQYNAQCILDFNIIHIHYTTKFGKENKMLLIFYIHERKGSLAFMIMKLLSNSQYIAS